MLRGMMECQERTFLVWGEGSWRGKVHRKCEMTVTDEGRDVREEVCMRGRNFCE
jgi:hypothetical protein